MVKASLTVFLSACLFVISACGPSQSGTEILPDEDRTVEGEEAPLNKSGPNFGVLAKLQEPEYTKEEIDAILERYAYIDRAHQIPTGLLKRAVLYFHANRDLIPNKNYLSVVDFAAHSSRKRFFVIDLRTGAVEGYRTSHGTGSDANNNGLLNGFSNLEGSLASSRGNILTAEIYHGKWGRSLRLDGLSEANSNMRMRAVVIHGASYVEEREVQQGRSWGCLALSMAIKDQLITKIAGGSVIYAGLSPEHWSPLR